VGQGTKGRAKSTAARFADSKISERNRYPVAHEAGTKRADQKTYNRRRSIGLSWLAGVDLIGEMYSCVPKETKKEVTE